MTDSAKPPISSESKQRASTYSVLVINLTSTAISVVFSIYIAKIFGVSRSIEVYFAATAVYASASHVLQVGSLTSIFVPRYHQIRARHGVNAAYEALSIMANWLLIANPFVILLALLLSRPLVESRIPGFDSSSIVEAIQIFRVVIPLILLDTLAALFQCLINAEKQFGKPELINTVSRLAHLAVSILLVPTHGIWALVVALWTGSLIRVFGLAIYALRCGFRYHLKLKTPSFHPLSLFSNLGLTWGYSLATQVFLFRFDAAVSNMSAGSFAIFKHLQKLMTITESLLLRPISTVFFNHYSDAVSRGGKEVRNIAHTALTQCLAISCFGFTLAVTCLQPCLEFFLASDIFPQDDIQTLALIYPVGLIAVFLNAYGHLHRQITLVIGKIRSLYTCMIVCQLLSCVLTYSLLEWPSFAIGLGILISNTVLLLLAPLWLLQQENRGLIYVFSMKLILKWTMVSVASIAIGKTVYACSLALVGFPIPLAIVATAIASSLAIAFLGYFLRIPEVSGLVQKIMHWRREAGPVANA